jgi:hypothetical protein
LEYHKWNEKGFSVDVLAGFLAVEAVECGLCEKFKGYPLADFYLIGTWNIAMFHRQIIYKWAIFIQFP